MMYDKYINNAILVKSVWGVLGRNKQDALIGNGNEGKRKLG